MTGRWWDVQPKEQPHLQSQNNLFFLTYLFHNRCKESCRLRYSVSVTPVVTTGLRSKEEKDDWLKLESLLSTTSEFQFADRNLPIDVMNRESNWRLLLPYHPVGCFSRLLRDSIREQECTLQNFLVGCYATQHPVISVRQLVGRSVGWSVGLWVG